MSVRTMDLVFLTLRVKNQALLLELIHRVPIVPLPCTVFIVNPEIEGGQHFASSILLIAATAKHGPEVFNNTAVEPPGSKTGSSR